jgi:uncharacterized membrane protein YdcZ (DUF606 family)
MMSETIAQLAKWCTIPVLLTASMFSYFTARYEPLVDMAICLGAMIFIQRAVWSREYVWAGGLLAIVVVFSPIALTGKIFLLMAITGLGCCVSLFGALRPHPVEAL